MRRKFQYDYAGELARRGLSYATHGRLIRAAALALMQRGEYRRADTDDYHETIDANRRAIIAEIDLMSPKMPPRPASGPETRNN